MPTEYFAWNAGSAARRKRAPELRVARDDAHEGHGRKQGSPDLRGQLCSRPHYQIEHLDGPLLEAESEMFQLFSGIFRKNVSIF